MEVWHLPALCVKVVLLMLDRFQRHGHSTRKRNPQLGSTPVVIFQDVVCFFSVGFYAEQKTQAEEL